MQRKRTLKSPAAEAFYRRFAAEAAARCAEDESRYSPYHFCPHCKQLVTRLFARLDGAVLVEGYAQEHRCKP